MMLQIRCIQLVKRKEERKEQNARKSKTTTSPAKGGVYKAERRGRERVRTSTPITPCYHIHAQESCGAGQNILTGNAFNNGLSQRNFDYLYKK